MTERFQPRTISSFSVHQLGQISAWAEQSGVSAQDGFSYQKEFRKALDLSTSDERGKPLDERGKIRLLLALRVMTKMANDQESFNGIHGDIQIWQVGPNPEALELRWQIRDSSYVHFKSYNRFLERSARI